MTDIPTITQEEAVEVRARKLLAREVGDPQLVITLLSGRETSSETVHVSAALAAIASALSPNMDHAVGGEEAAWDWLFLKADAGQYAPNDRDYSADEMVGAFMAGLGRSTPPVNQDAVREALGRIANGEAFRCQRFAEDDDAEYFLRAQRGVVELARAALATPPLDNTGLDAATVEPVRSTILEAAEALTREDWQIATTCGDMIDRLPCARCGAKSIKLCRSGLSIDKIDAARDFVNGYGWAAARERALASGDRS